MLMSLAGVIAVANMASAKPKEKSSSANQMMEAPQPAQEVAKLMAWTGTFEGEASVSMNGKTTPFKLKHMNRQASQGWALICEEKADIPEMGRYEAVNIFGFDAGKKMLHLYTVSNMGDTHDHWGKWTNDKTFDMKYEGMQDGKPMVETIHCVFDSPTQYHFTSETKVGGQMYSTFSATMVKVGEAQTLYR
jgi:hypothetical protein